MQEQKKFKQTYSSWKRLHSIHTITLPKRVYLPHNKRKYLTNERQKYKKEEEKAKIYNAFFHVPRWEMWANKTEGEKERNEDGDAGQFSFLHFLYRQLHACVCCVCICLYTFWMLD